MHLQSIQTTANSPFGRKATPPGNPQSVPEPTTCNPFALKESDIVRHRSPSSVLRFNLILLWIPVEMSASWHSQRSANQEYGGRCAILRHCSLSPAKRLPGSARQYRDL